MTPGLINSSDEKFRLLDIANKSNNLNDYLTYKKYLNLFTMMKEKAREEYYTAKAFLYSQDKSKTWQLVNELCSRKRKKQTTCKSIRNKNGEKLENPLDIANCLNDHFGCVGKNMAEKLQQNGIENLPDPLDYIPNTSQQSMCLFDTDEYELYNLICNLHVRKACGYDLISNRILKNSCKTILPYITTLFNQCMRQGVFPSVYKVAQVIPLYKGGDKEDVNSYRPISLLPSLGKLLEKVISVRTVKFLDKNNIITPHQFGFRAKFSTEQAILDIYEKLLKNLDDNVSTCAIFLDLAKAFDSVSIT